MPDKTMILSEKKLAQIRKRVEMARGVAPRVDECVTGFGWYAHDVALLLSALGDLQRKCALVENMPEGYLAHRIRPSGRHYWALDVVGQPIGQSRATPWEALQSLSAASAPVCVGPCLSTPFPPEVPHVQDQD